MELLEWDTVARKFDAPESLLNPILKRVFRSIRSVWGTASREEILMKHEMF